MLTTYANKKEMESVKCMHFFWDLGAHIFARVSQQVTANSVPMGECLIDNHKNKRGVILIILMADCTKKSKRRVTRKMLSE